jgi:hypothetical protein
MEDPLFRLQLRLAARPVVTLAVCGAVALVGAPAGSAALAAGSLPVPVPAISDYQFLSASTTPPAEAACFAIGRRCFTGLAARRILPCLYGTDGFAVALGDPSRRDELAAIAGDEAERLVYLYASCDRGFSYPYLARPAGPFRDRFTGTVLRPPRSEWRDFAELTVVNELDIAAVNPDLRAQSGPVLLRLFSSWRHLLSQEAWQAVQVTML